MRLHLVHRQRQSNCSGAAPQVQHDVAGLDIRNRRFR
jgi:hypothetical protein